MLKRALERRLAAIAAEHPESTLADLGKIEGHPFWRLDFPGDPSLRICLAGGIHGDEPAGVEALLRFLESFQESVSLTCFPLMNPAALLDGSRCGPSGIDLNRLFGKGGNALNVLFEKAVEKESWDLFVDLHEDYQAQGFYALEVASECGTVANEVAQALSEEGLPVEKKAELLAMLEEEGGYPLLSVDDGSALLEKKERIGILQAPFMALRHAGKALTFETPSSLPFEARVCMHGIALRAALDHLIDSKAPTPPSFAPWSGRRDVR